MIMLLKEPKVNLLIVLNQSIKILKLNMVRLMISNYLRFFAFQFISLLKELNFYQHVIPLNYFFFFSNF